VGPFEKIEEAERAKEKLDKSGIETVLVKVQR
jgi:cell division protein FtsN